MFKRFNSIDEDYLYTDKHIHSNWSDGNACIKDISQGYKERGMRHIAITDHIGAISGQFDTYCREIESVSRELQMKIFVGFEARVVDFNGNIAVSKDIIDMSHIRIASIHRFPMGRKLYYAREFDKRICQEIELELSMAALKNRNINLLGHPGGMSLRAYGEFPMDFFEELLIQCSRVNVAFDLNSDYHYSILDALMGLLRKYNPYVSIGSDLHRIENLGECLGQLQASIM